MWPNGQIKRYSIKYSNNDKPLTTSNLNITIPNLKAGITYNITVQPITEYNNLLLMGAISIIIPVTLNTITPNISKDGDDALTRCAHIRHMYVLERQYIFNRHCLYSTAMQLLNIALIT